MQIYDAGDHVLAAKIMALQGHARIQLWTQFHDLMTSDAHIAFLVESVDRVHHDCVFQKQVVFIGHHPPLSLTVALGGQKVSLAGPGAQLAFSENHFAPSHGQGGARDVRPGGEPDPAVVQWDLSPF